MLMKMGKWSMNTAWTNLSVDPAIILYMFILQAGVDQEVLVLKNRAFKTPSKEETSGTSGTSIKEWESHWMTRTWTTGETKATTLSQGWKHEKKVFMFLKETLMLVKACLPSETSLILIILRVNSLNKPLTLSIELTINYNQIWMFYLCSSSVSRDPQEPSSTEWSPITRGLFFFFFTVDVIKLFSHSFGRFVFLS